MQAINAAALKRRTEAVEVCWRGRRVVIGGGAPVVVQSMTNTSTTDVEATVAQVIELSKAGSELVRLTVNTPEAARSVVEIRRRLDEAGCFTPLVGDFHYNGHKLLTDEPECARALSKYRINPGNVGRGDKGAENFAVMIEAAKTYDKPIRIGVNGGSIDSELLESLLEENRRKGMPLEPQQVFLEAMVQSAVQSADSAVELGLAKNKIILSAKVSSVPDLISVYRALSKRCSYALHLGLTEAGIGSKGVVASSSALAILLNEGIGDTIRVSITPSPGAARTEEVVVAQEILQCLGLRSFAPMVTSCPGCGRTASDLFQRLAQSTQTFLRERMSDWRADCPGVESMKVAVMGCVVNGPGESRAADIGISLPGSGENPVAPVYVRGEKVCSLKGEGMQEEFQQLIEKFVQQTYAKKQ